MKSAFYFLARRRAVAVALSLALLAVATSALLFACTQSPTEVPVRTFERAQKIDVVCIRLYDPPPVGQPLNNFTARPQPIGRPESDCQPVPADLDGESFDRQLFALVTQTQRGELAIVDLTAGKLVDTKRAIPGINFLPVGANPTGVAVTPDGKMAFVASAETNKPAIYAIPTRRLLGDTQGFAGDPNPITIKSWPVCALPQNPGAIAIVPRKPSTSGTPTTGDAGADGGDGGDGGAAPATADIEPTYDIVVVLPGDRINTAKILTLDPRPFRRGGLPTLDGAPDYDSIYEISDRDGEKRTLGPSSLPGGDSNPAAIMKPGELQPCAVAQESAIELVGGSVLPASFTAGPGWQDGVPYVDGGVDLTCDRPQTTSTTCTNTPCCAPDTIEAGVPDAATDAAANSADAGTCVPLGSQDAGSIPLSLGPIDSPRLVSLVRTDQLLYIADEGAPLIHVVDISTPSAPKEMPPLLATSVADPKRIVKVKDIALSPPTRDFKKFIYGIDEADGTLMVYDVTDPLSTQRTPLIKPHPELNPFEPIDRISFATPVVAVAFAQHDVPLGSINGSLVPSAASGVLCNPNPALDPARNGGALPDDLGYYYRNDITDPGQVLGPRRLRGIFAFATLSNGDVAVIDVDDWDAPCRRPQNMSVDVSGLGKAQTDPGDRGAYHAPKVDDLATLDELYFPVSAPHTLRSALPLTFDDVNGTNVPHLVGTPIITSNGVTLTEVGPGSEKTPVLSTPLFSFETPQVAASQNWFVTYEGSLPGFSGLSGILSTTDNYETLTLSQQQAHFCGKGVEDYSRGKDRTAAINAELQRRGTSLPDRSDRWMSDYVQMTEDLLDASDDYWSLDQACWDGALSQAPGQVRHDACDRIYGTFAADQKSTRDFPILEAYDDHIVLGRYGVPPGFSHREVIDKSDTNAADLKFMQCCFHNTPKFGVRTGQVWSVIGLAPGSASGLGFFSHMTQDSAGRCVQSCDPREALLNGRLPTVPTGIPFSSINSNGALGLRNPLFVIALTAGPAGVEPIRDSQYTFAATGGFTVLTVSTSGGTIAVNPQSMRYIDSLGQMAVVDGASQGLNLIDLQNVVIARAPYF